MIKFTKEDFEKKIKERFPEEEFTILNFEGTAKPFSVKCEKCGETIEVSRANNFLAPNKRFGCKNCHGLHHERERKLKAIEERYDIISTQVKDSHIYYKIKCKECGHIRENTIYGLYRTLECGCKTNCKRNRTAEEFIKEVNQNSLYGDYSLVSEYKNQVEKVLLRHEACGFIWSVRPGDVIHGKSACPRCIRKQSKGEKIVERILQELGIVDYIREEPLKDSRQRFDFFIPSLNIAIEYNGEQHYKNTGFFQTPLEVYQERDSRKAKYCEDNSIKLIIIPYTMKEEEIKSYIEQEINSTTILKESTL